MVLRTLIAGISIPDRDIREQSLDRMTGFIERHIKVTFTDPKTGRKESPDEFRCQDSDVFRRHILMLLGEIHEVFMYD